MRTCKGNDAGMVPKAARIAIDNHSGHQFTPLPHHKPNLFDIGRQFGTLDLHVKGMRIPYSINAR